MLHIDQTLLSQVQRHARRMFPEECCGILLGSRSGMDVHVRRVVQATNIARGDRTRSYQIDWAALLTTARDARGGADDVVGFYHSHPDGSATPSTRDAVDAWVERSYLIVPVTDDGCGAATSWRRRVGGVALERETIKTTRPAAFSLTTTPGNARLCRKTLFP